VKPLVTMRKALNTPDLLGGVMAKPSWSKWKILLIAAAGERLTPAERVVFKQLTGRNKEPGELVNTFAALAGRRSGKSFALAIFLVWISCLVDHRDTLTVGETGVALCIAQSQRVARIIKDYVVGIISASPVLSTMLVNTTADTVELKDKIVIEVRPCSAKTSRGMSCVCICCDELAHWYVSTDFVDPDVEVLSSLRPTSLTTRGPTLMSSSVYARAGVLYDTWKQHYGPDGDPSILVCFGTSRDLNDSLSQSEIDREIERDPIRNRAEYLSEFRSDVSGFIDRAVVMECVNDYLELLPDPTMSYFCFQDSATGIEGGDSYAASIMHRAADGKVVVDALREARPPFSPTQVINDIIVPLCKAYNVVAITGDNFGGNFAQEPLRAAGLNYEVASRHKSSLYNDPFLSLLSSKQIVLPRHERAIAQICALERSTLRSGRDQITHPDRGRDDLANCIAGGASLVYDGSGYLMNMAQWCA
jgi:hypothetical protein